MSKINISIDCTSYEDHCDVDIKYSGKCTPLEFDRAVLSMISFLTRSRDEEMKRRGNEIYRNYDDDISEYSKR